MSQLQQELSKFLQDFDAVKQLLDEEVEMKSPPPSTQHQPQQRRSFYDNVTPSDTDDRVLLCIPDVRVSPADTPTPPPTRTTPTMLTTFPAPTRPVSLAEPINIAPVMRGRRAAAPPPTPKRTSSSTLPHVQCTKCGHFLCRHDAAAESFPAYFTLAAPRCTSCKKHVASSKGEEAATEDTPPQVPAWKVRFDGEDKTPPRWGGGAKVSPLMRGRQQDHHHQHQQQHPPMQAVPHQKPSRARILLLIAAGVIILLSLLGIVVAVTCAFILSALQDEVKEGSSLTGCGIQVYNGQLSTAWHFNLSCNEQFNNSLADISSPDFIRAAKVYEVMLDMIFRSSQSSRDFDFSKVDAVRCMRQRLDDDRQQVTVYFKIYWRAMSQKELPEPAVVLQHFLSTKTIKDENQKNRIHFVSIEGAQN